MNRRTTSLGITRTNFISYELADACSSFERIKSLLIDDSPALIA